MRLRFQHRDRFADLHSPRKQSQRITFVFSASKHGQALSSQVIKQAHKIHQNYIAMSHFKGLMHGPESGGHRD